eukprot:5747095-Alexandrium_andersonii.AAC.1
MPLSGVVPSGLLGPSLSATVPLSGDLPVDPRQAIIGGPFIPQQLGPQQFVISTPGAAIRMPVPSPNGEA